MFEASRHEARLYTLDRGMAPIFERGSLTSETRVRKAQMWT